MKEVLKTRDILKKSPKPMKDNNVHTPIPGRYTVVVGCSSYDYGAFRVYACLDVNMRRNAVFGGQRWHDPEANPTINSSGQLWL